MPRLRSPMARSDGLELVAAVAAQRAERVAGQALGVHAHAARRPCRTGSPLTMATWSLPSRLFQKPTMWKVPKRVGRSATAAMRTQMWSLADAGALVVGAGRRRAGRS